MNTMSAIAMGMASRGRELKVFDWIKAAQILADRKPAEAIAGLQLDMEWTAGSIWRDGAPVPRADTYTFLASSWAIPILEIDGEEIPCFKMQSETPCWDSDTYWPEEAVGLLSTSGNQSNLEQV